MPPANVRLITRNHMIRLTGLGSRLQNCTIMPAKKVQPDCLPSA